MKNKQAIVKFNIPDKTSQRTRHILKKSSHDFKRRNYRPFSLFVTLLLFFTITLTSLKYFTKNTIAFQPDEFVTTWDVSHLPIRAHEASQKKRILLKSALWLRT